MNAKITLYSNKDLIKKIKKYAKAKNTSVSAIVNEFFKSLLEKNENSPIDSLAGIFKDKQVNKNTLLQALNSNFNDFEESVIYSSVYLNNIDYLVRRDKKGYKNSKVKILSLTEAVARIKALKKGI